MKSFKKLAAITVLGCCASGAASAGGLYITETSNSADIPYGGINFLARANDASTVFTNPAGMTRFKQTEKLLGGQLLYLKGPFRPDGNNTVSGHRGSASEFLPSGNFAYVKPLNDQWSFGLSAHNYFGLGLNWGSSWTGRYSGNQAIIIAPQIQPTVAYKLNDAWSVGVGLGLTLGYLKDKVSISTPVPGDGKFRYSDTDFAVQPNLGLMYEPSENTRIGLRYLMETDLDFKDDPEITGASGGDFDVAGKLGLSVVMPQQILAGVWRRVSDDWAVLGSVGWEDWSRFGQIQVEITETIIDDTVKIATEDTWHIGIGGEYQASTKLMYTMGVSWDSSWQRDKNRTPIVPIGTVWRLGGGIKYQKSEDFTWGGGLSIFYEGDLPIKPIDTSHDGTLSGKYSNVVLYWASLYASWR